MAEHRMSMLGGSLRRRSDPAESRDPRIRAVVAQLATVSGPELRSDFRADLRAQLVAITPRIVAEGDPAAVGTRAVPVDGRSRAADLTPGRGAGRSTSGSTGGSAGRSTSGSTGRVTGARARSGGLALGRPLTVAASLVIVLTLALSGALLLSRKALPGDALYGLKRAGESVQLTLDTSDPATAHDLLHFATIRVSEVQDLLDRSRTTALGAGVQAGGSEVSAATSKLITTALDSADADTRRGATLLKAQAEHNRSAAPLVTLTGWAKGQANDIFRAWNTAPVASPVRTRMAASLMLVKDIASRLHTLSGQVVTGSGSPTPTPGAPTVTPGFAGTSTPVGRTSVPGGGSSGSGGGSGGSGGGSVGGSSQTAAPTPGSSHSPAGATPAAAPAKLPGALPATLPSSASANVPGQLSTRVPIGVRVSPCDVSVSAGSLGVGMPTPCGSG